MVRHYGNKMTRTMRNLVLAAGIALALAACGKKTDLQRPLPPPDVPKDASGKNADPNRPFVLDPLLR
jgi:predicted small lipoprotein YifL